MTQFVRARTLSAARPGRQERSAAELPLHQLISRGRVELAFIHQSLAEQIIPASRLWGIEITTKADRERRRAEADAAHKPRGPIQNLRYVMEKWTRLLMCLKSRVEMHS